MLSRCSSFFKKCSRSTRRKEGDAPFGGSVFVVDASAWARARSPAVRTEWSKTLLGDQFRSTAITKLEILYSARTAAQYDEWDEALSGLRELPINAIDLQRGCHGNGPAGGAFGRPSSRSTAGLPPRGMRRRARNRCASLRSSLRPASRGVHSKAGGLRQPGRSRRSLHGGERRDGAATAPPVALSSRNAAMPEPSPRRDSASRPRAHPGHRRSPPSRLEARVRARTSDPSAD